MSDASRDRVCVVTGSTGGIGTALCEAFRTASYDVIGLDIADPAAGGSDTFVKGDLRRMVAEPDYGASLIGAIRARLPEGELHALVNNAAVQVLGNTDAVTADAWRQTFDVNVLAPFYLTQQLLPELRAGRGAVVNISSVHADQTKPGFVAYATSKAALAGLTRALAVDLGGEVRVNAIQPAATGTAMLLEGFREHPDRLDELARMHPIGRIADPSEVAEVAVFLASDRASFMTGAVVPVDGGVMARLHDPG